MESSEPLHNQLKINSLKNNIILSNCLFQMFLNSFSNLLRNQLPKYQRQVGFHQHILNVPKLNTQMFGSNSLKIKSINDWN